MLDTNASSAAIRGHAGVEERLRMLPLSAWCISAITCSEHRHGLEMQPEATRLARIVEAFLNTATVLPWDGAAANAHARVRAHLQRQGTPIGAYDEMIAGHALSIGAVLVTDNVRHFERVPGLVLENWVRVS
jgi:tRNA(fMet)-specific endonuclease VapC